MIAKVAGIEATRPTDAAYGNYGFGGSYWFEGDLYDKGTSCVFWYCPAKHSSVALFAYQTTWQLAVIACNHGTCAGNSKMSYDCNSNSGVWRDKRHDLGREQTARRRSAAAASRATAGTAAATTTSATTTRRTSCGRSRTVAPVAVRSGHQRRRLQLRL